MIPKQEVDVVAGRLDSMIEKSFDNGYVVLSDRIFDCVIARLINALPRCAGTQQAGHDIGPAIPCSDVEGSLTVGILLVRIDAMLLQQKGGDRNMPLFGCDHQRGIAYFGVDEIDLGSLLDEGCHVHDVVMEGR
jgi:hypothetical protein